MPTSSARIDFTRLNEAVIQSIQSKDTLETRWQQILGLANLARSLEKAAPDPAALQRVRDYNEMAWQRAHSRLLLHAGL